MGKTEPVKITFYIGKHHKDFRNKMKTHLRQLETKNIEYIIFERDDKLLPTLCTSNRCTVGLKNIQEKLHSIMSA